MPETERPEECEGASCDNKPLYELAYTEDSLHNYRWLCAYHKNMERLHDPYDTKIVTEPWEVHD